MVPFYHLRIQLSAAVTLGTTHAIQVGSNPRAITNQLTTLELLSPAFPSSSHTSSAQNGEVRRFGHSISGQKIPLASARVALRV